MKNLKLKIKNLILVLAALVFAVGILTTSVYRTSALTPLETMEFEIKEGKEGEEGPPAGEAGATIEAREPVEYILTYPGILPDHFLYPIKMLRDRIWLFLTTDPLKKAELLLKLADKRIWSAQMLIGKDRVDLGISTATKAEKYLEQAIEQEKVARGRGKDTVAFLEKLSKATLKHEEVLLGVREKLEDPARSVIENTLEYSRRGYEEVLGRLGR